MTALRKHKPRWLQELRARRERYFWLPCPICGRDFGGQEWHHKDQAIPVKSNDPSRGTAICPWCAEAGWGRILTKHLVAWHTVKGKNA